MVATASSAPQLDPLCSADRGRATEIRREEQRMDATRFLIIIADDFGIGPDISRGILELAARNLVTGTVLLVNSPYAEEAVHAWRQSASHLEMGWHPCLTLDGPMRPASRVPSLLGPDGRLLRLPHFLARLHLHQICPRTDRDGAARAVRSLSGTGRTPSNDRQLAPAHFAVPSRRLDPAPRSQGARYAAALPASRSGAVVDAGPHRGARKKRTLLTLLGRIEARHQAYEGFPGNDWLAGITDPPHGSRSRLLRAWLALVPGRIVELVCHPGHRDATLIGRDCTEQDGLVQRRLDELQLLQQANFLDALPAGRLSRACLPRRLLARRTGRLADAA